MSTTPGMLNCLIWWAIFCGSAEQADLQVSEWGKEFSGLQCRATLPRQLEQGAVFRITVEFRTRPGNVPRSATVLNPCRDICTFFALHLEDPTTKRHFRLKANYRTFGPPPLLDKGQHAIPLDSAPFGRSEPTFTLSRLEPRLPPGSYRCSIRYAQPDGPTPRWGGTHEEWAALGAWAGTIESEAVTLDVAPETPKTRTFLLPKALRVLKKPYHWSPGLPKPPREAYLVTTYTDEDAEETVLPVRNGHWVGHIISGGYGETLRGGSPRPGDPNAIDQWYEYRAGDRHVTYRITLFETCADNPRFVGPGSCGYKVLWEKTFELHLTEAEIMNILGE